MAQLGRMSQTLLQRTRELMVREDIPLGAKAQETINKALAQYRTLATVYRFKQQLKGIWIRTSNSHASRVQQLQTWCTEAKQTGIRTQEDSAQCLRAYGLREV